MSVKSTDVTIVDMAFGRGLSTGSIVSDSILTLRADFFPYSEGRRGRSQGCVDLLRMLIRFSSREHR